eukprot:XP_003945469.2 PREDICTED: uncharacterized protein B230311B06Rik isoform X1 [Mus musculus]
MIPQDRQKECPSSLPHSGLLTSQGPPQMYFRSIWKTFPSYGGNDFRLYPFPSALLHCPALSSDYSLSLGRTWLKSPRQEMNPDESQSFSEVAHGLDAAAQNAVRLGVCVWDSYGSLMDPVTPASMAQKQCAVQRRRATALCGLSPERPHLGNATSAPPQRPKASVCGCFLCEYNSEHSSCCTRLILPSVRISCSRQAGCEACL